MKSLSSKMALALGLGLFLMGCFVRRGEDREEYWSVAQIVEINSPTKTGMGDFQIVWKDDRGVSHNEYQRDTAGLNYYVGRNRQTLIEK